MRFADLTTFRVGGEIAKVVSGDSEEIILKTLLSDSDAYVVGGGSNILASDTPFNGTVLVMNTKGSELDYDACSGGMITVAAGVLWDEFVAQTVEAGFSGLETLSGIPGKVGAAPIQNIGAYGQEFSSVVARVRTWDRSAKEQRTFTANQCAFGYRTSLFKREPNRYVILDVTVQLKKGELSIPITYPELAKELAITVGDRAAVSKVRERTLAIRARKGMVLSEQDRDSWSAGSFFINPSVSPEIAATLSGDAPRWPNVDGSIKLSAAWLLERSGIAKGERLGGAGISTKHVLAITNAAEATSVEIIELARRCQRLVQEQFDITLTPEVQLVGLEI
jgi:UDP-N-acetylmuramate dehydrogenase